MMGPVIDNYSQEQAEADRQLGAMVQKMPEGWWLLHTYGHWAVFDDPEEKPLGAGCTPDDALRAALGTEDA